MKDGGQAFPAIVTTMKQQPGMTLRQWYKGMALQGELAGRHTWQNGCTAEEIVMTVAKVADAMIAEDKEHEGKK